MAYSVCWEPATPSSCKLCGDGIVRDPCPQLGRSHAHLADTGGGASMQASCGGDTSGFAGDLGGAPAKRARDDLASADLGGTGGLPDRKRCVLCDVEEGISLCGRCFVPWLPRWLDSMVLPEYLRSSDIGPDAFVCYQCVSEEEFGLSALSDLDSDQRARLADIEARADQNGGFDPIDIVQVATLFRKSD